MIFSRSYLKYLLIIASIAASAMCTLPLMSVYSGGTESCTLIVRGFNLIEFSEWGVIPIISPILILRIIFSKHKTCSIKETELLVLFIVNLVCYIHSFNSAKAWLYDVGDSFITYYPWAILIPFGFALVLILVEIFDIITQRYCRFDTDDLPF